MTGADDKTVLDVFGDVVFATEAEQIIVDYLNAAKALGFQIRGTTIFAPREIIHQALLRKPRQIAVCNHEGEEIAQFAGISAFVKSQALLRDVQLAGFKVENNRIVGNAQQIRDTLEQAAPS